jgi:RHS repeat-associated protein
MLASDERTAGRAGSLRDRLPRVKDDNDCDSSDETVFDALPHTVTYPARRSSLLGQPFAHQGLFLDPEIASYPNRARQYGPGLRRFVQRDPLALGNNPGGGLQDALNAYLSLEANASRFADPSGLLPYVPGYGKYCGNCRGKEYGGSGPAADCLDWACCRHDTCWFRAKPSDLDVLFHVLWFGFNRDLTNCDRAFCRRAYCCGQLPPDGQTYRWGIYILFSCLKYVGVFDCDDYRPRPDDN